MRRLSDKVFMMGIGHALREIREAKGYTQLVVAENACITDVSLSRYEAAERIPDCIILYRITEALGVEISEVYKRICDFV